VAWRARLRCEVAPLPASAGAAVRVGARRAPHGARCRLSSLVLTCTLSWPAPGARLRTCHPGAVRSPSWRARPPQRSTASPHTPPPHRIPPPTSHGRRPAAGHPGRQGPQECVCLLAHPPLLLLAHPCSPARRGRADQRPLRAARGRRRRRRGALGRRQRSCRQRWARACAAGARRCAAAASRRCAARGRARRHLCRRHAQAEAGRRERAAAAAKL